MTLELISLGTQWVAEFKSKKIKCRKYRHAPNVADKFFTHLFTGHKEDFGLLVAKTNWDCTFLVVLNRINVYQRYGGLGLLQGKFHKTPFIVLT